jgi:hypothetical protein
MAITQAASRMISDLNAGSTYITGTLGTAASNIVQLTAAAKLPAVDGSLLTGISTGGGKVLQVVQTSLTAQSALTSTSLADSGHPAASLTPATTGSKVLINYTGNWGESVAGIETLIVVYRQIASGGYSVLAGTMVGKKSETGYVHAPLSINFLDAPSTTSQVDYKIYYTISSGEVYYNYIWSVGAGNPGSNLIITEIGA